MSTMQQSTSPRFIPVADHGVLVEFDGGIETALNKRVARLARTLQRCLPNGVGPVVPTYRSLLIHYDAGVQTQAAVCDWLRGVLADAEPAPLRCRRWRIPVCYGGDYGMDLEAVARYHALSPDDVIALH